MLRIDLSPGESVTIGGYATITLEQKSGGRARLAFEADRSIPIRRVPDGRTAAAIASEHGIGLPKQ